MSASDNKTGSDVKRPLRDGIDTVRDAAGSVVDKAKDGAAIARDKAVDAYAGASDRAGAATSGAIDQIADNPLLALAGGIAIGALLGALLPRTEREAALLGPIGGRLQASARDAAGAARGAGREKLAELGFSGGNAQNLIKSIVDAALNAVTSAGGAAIDAAHEKATPRD